jgi:Fe2+ transport system protein FeoA
MKLRNCFRGFGKRGALSEQPDCGGRLFRQAGTDIIDVTKLVNDESARVVELVGGGKTAGKLAALGLVPGATITKKSASPMQGPVILAKGLSQFAIGYGMARRVMVERINADDARQR